jgi:hypothetical protein
MEAHRLAQWWLATQLIGRQLISGLQLSALYALPCWQMGTRILKQILKKKSLVNMESILMFKFPLLCHLL